jgi:tRNA dimethylallyltransferase
VNTIVVAGPTGTGKSALALRLASTIGGEIVNYDSVQIYRGFDIGSAKPPAFERERVPHHLFDIADATEEINAAEYAKRAAEAVEAISARGNRPIFVGGTFFYLRAFLSGLPEMPGRNEPVRARLRTIAARPAGQQRLHRWLTRVDATGAAAIAPNDRHRVERALEVWILTGRPITSWSPPEEERPSVKLALTMERTALSRMLDERVESMYASGLVAETKRLLERYPANARPFGTIGYREAVAVLQGTLREEQAVAETKRRTRAYAKRQMTWLRSERNVHWVEANDRDEAFRSAMRIIEGNE